MSNSSYLRAVRGPVLLIALGTLMWIDHFSTWSVWRTWPVLLVVLGVMILAERVFSSAGSSGQGGVS